MKPAKCTVRDGRFVDPCWTLAELADGYPVRRGFQLVTLSDIKTHRKTRSFVTLKEGPFQKNGIVVNYCPFCGTDIMAPALLFEDEAARAEKARP